MLAGLGQGSVLVDNTTASASIARELASATAAKSAGFLDAPVSGGEVGAEKGTLTVMVGGDRDLFGKAEPIIASYAQRVTLMGPTGCGQLTKMVNQILLAATMVGVGEALLYARASGLDPRRVLDSVGQGAAASWSLNNLLPRILNGDLEPGFYVEHFVKDMGIVLDEAGRMGLALPGLALAKQLYTALAAQGHGRDGTQALMLALASLSGIDWLRRS